MGPAGAVLAVVADRRAPDMRQRRGSRRRRLWWPQLTGGHVAAGAVESVSALVPTPYAALGPYERRLLRMRRSRLRSQMS